MTAEMARYDDASAQSAQVKHEEAPDAPGPSTITEPEGPVVTPEGLVAAPPPMAPPVMEVGRADDPAEAEADRIADAVLRRLSGEPGPPGSTPSAEPGGADEQGVAAHDRGSALRPPPHALRRSAGGDSAVVGAAGGDSAVVGAAGGPLSERTSKTIEALRRRGRPLPSDVKDRMESGFRTDFSHVRIHDYPDAARMSRALSAHAFTSGNDIFFADHDMALGRAGSEHVLAHELAHVTQAQPTVQRFLGRFRKKKSKAGTQAPTAMESDEDSSPGDVSGGESSSDEPKLSDKERKDRINESKEARKDTKKAQGKERRENEEIRTDVKKLIVEEQNTKDANGERANTSSTYANLMERMDIALAKEKSLVDQYSSTMPAEKAAQRAYDETWLPFKKSDPQLFAVKPDRQTQAERLTRRVRNARVDAGVRDSVEQEVARGKNRPEELDLVYEQFVIDIDAMIAGGVPPAEAEVLAEKTTWDRFPASSADRARRGSPDDLAAREEARKRLQLIPKSAWPPVSWQDALVDSVQQGADEVTEKMDSAPADYGSEALNFGLKTGGAPETLSIRKDLAKGKSDHDSIKAGEKSAGGDDTKIPILGPVVKSIKQAEMQKKNDVRKVAPGAVDASDATKLSGIFGSFKDLLYSLTTGVSGIMKAVKAVKKAHEAETHAARIAATKAVADAMALADSGGKNAAKYGASIAPQVSANVDAMIPGWSIASGVRKLVSAAMQLALTCMNVHHVRTSLDEAHLAKESGSTGPNVMVYPLERIERTYVKTLEQHVWSTTMTVSDLAASIAEVASGGGFGIPAAYKATTGLLSTLHSAGHLIADDVLVYLTKKSQTASLEHVEGAAEQQLSTDPAMAVDGLIMAAVDGDTIAQDFLANYEVDGKPITPQMLAPLGGDSASPGHEKLLTVIRAAVLTSMGESEKPVSLFKKFKDKFSAPFKSLGKRRSRASKLAKQRNSQDGKKRGVGWKLKMMLKNSEGMSKSERKTNLAEDERSIARRIGVECQCGLAVLPTNATPAQQKAFLDELDAMSIDAVLAGAKDPHNTDEWQEFLLTYAYDRIQDKQQAGDGA